MKTYFVYIMTNRTRRLYIGVTSDLNRRVYQHQHRLVPGFTSKYHLDRLVYFEEAPDPASAITREKQLKGWLRSRKVALVEIRKSQVDGPKQAVVRSNERRIAVRRSFASLKMTTKRRMTEQKTPPDAVPRWQGHRVSAATRGV